MSFEQMNQLNLNRIPDPTPRQGFSDWVKQLLTHSRYRLTARYNRLRRADWKMLIRMVAFIVGSLINIAFVFKGFKLAQQEISFIWPGIAMTAEMKDQLWHVMYLGVLGCLYCASILVWNWLSKSRNSLTKSELVTSKIGLYVSAGIYAALIFASKNGFFFGLGLLITGAKGIWRDLKKRSSEREAARQWVVCRASELLIEELESVYNLRQMALSPPATPLECPENLALTAPFTLEVAEMAVADETTLNNNDPT